MSAVPPGPAGEDDPLPSPEQIRNWSTSHLTAGAKAWRKAADKSKKAFEEHYTNISGTDWEGDAKDAAMDRVRFDTAVADHHGEVLAGAAREAENGVTHIGAAKREAVAALDAAKNDGFTVGEDLSVTDARRYDINTIKERNKAVKGHASDIRWYAERLVEADRFAGKRLKAKAAELHGIRFQGEDDRGAHVQLVDNKTKTGPGDKDKPGEKPSGAGDPNGSLADLILPPEKPDGTTPHKPGEKPTAMDLIEQAKRDAAAAGQSGSPAQNVMDALTGKDGKGIGDPQYTKNPLLAPIVRADPSAVDQQKTRVEAAQARVDAAQAKADASVNQAITSGPYNGHDLNDGNPLARELFDARHNLVEQRQLLVDMNATAAETGGHQVPVPALPENADRQAFAPVPRESFMDAQRWTSHVIHEKTDGLVPDLFQDSRTATHWSEATPRERMELLGDAAGLVPIPGSKLGAEGLEHLAVEAFIHEAPPVATHGLTHDAVPVAPHGPADVPVAPHVPADVPVGGDHGLIGHGGDHGLPAGGDHGLFGHGGDVVPSHQHPADVFDSNQGRHYTSGDPHYPGGWPPHTPAETWKPGDTDPGWHYMNRGDRDWMPYQEQISGAERLHDGRIPEWAQIDPQTGKVVNFDGHVIRNGHEVFLDAKDGYSGLATDPGRPWTQGMERGIIEEIPRQLRALPPGASLEIHVSDPVGASAIRNLVEDNGWYDVSVIYTPKAP